MVATYKQLIRIGLTKGESKVYIALLELGSSTVGPIVNRSGIAYSNIYEVLQRLMEKGLASFVIKNKTKYFQAANPEYLKEFLEKKEKEIERNKRFLDEILPRIHMLQGTKPEQESEIFIGLKGLRAAYAKLVAGYTGGDWLFFYIYREEYAKESDAFFRSISPMFKKLQGLSARGVCNKEYKKSPFVKTATFMKVRYVDFPIPGIIDIYRDKILIVSWGAKPVSFLITSKQTADAMQEYFESVWKIAKK